MGDLLTQLQSELNRLHELFSCTVGELQTRAPPIPIRGSVPEDDLPPSDNYNVEERTKGFAKEAMATFKNIDQLITKLPEPRGSEQEQLARITELQQRDQKLQAELQEQAAIAEVKLKQVQGMYAAMAWHQLEQKFGAGAVGQDQPQDGDVNMQG